MDTRQVVARFEAERQALALMDHPHIAQVFDGGETASGRPYFVMELVRGVPITDFGDQNRLNVRERLGLFVSVCQAVQHAHQKGIIHRDLKPSNVLVTRHDGQAVAKVIDFGIAKATGQPLTDKTLFTGLAQLIGTPMYMSPEQAGQGGLDIDTRSDVYALGVLLYELLTGTTPFDQERLRTAGYEEVRRIIREEEPPRPSTRVSTLGPAAATVSGNRRSDPKKLGQLMRGDLDWIIMKALEKDRNRRYQTAMALAADVQRYLNDEPVEAGPPSAWYRFRKLARRKKGVLATASMACLAVLLAVAGLAASNARIREEQRQTQAEQRKTEEALQREKLASYYQCIALAERELKRRIGSRADELLDQCPERLRGWEWHYLKRLPLADFPRRSHEDIVLRVAFSPDGRQLASGDRPGTVKIWDAQTGKEQCKFNVGSHIWALAFSPKGRWLATGSRADGQAKVWDVSSGRLRLALPGHTKGIEGLAFSPDGRRLGSAGGDGTVRFWDFPSGRELLTFRGHEQPLAINGLSFSADGRRLTSVSVDGVVKVWETATGATVATLHPGGGWVVCAAFSRDGRWLALGRENGMATVYQTDPWKEVGTLEAHATPVRYLALSPDGRRLATSGDDWALKVWDVPTGHLALLLDIPSLKTTSLEFSPDGYRLASGSADKTVMISDGTPTVDAPRDSPLTWTAHRHRVVEVAFTRDSRRLVSASWDQTVKVWDLRSGERGVSGPRLRLTVSGMPPELTGVAVTPDGRLLAASSLNGTVTLCDARDGTKLATLRGSPGPVYGVAFDPVRGALASAHHDGTVKVWDIGRARSGIGNPLIRNIKVSPDHVLGVTYSADGRRLASAGGRGQGNVSIWEAGNLRGFYENDWVRSVAFSPDGRRLACAVFDWISLLDVETGQALYRTPGSGARIFRVVFSPDGRWLATAGDGQAVRFLDPATGKERTRLRVSGGELWNAAFSPDDRLATCSGYKGKGTIQIWHAGRWDN
jgi:WD40 repeat protein